MPHTTPAMLCKGKPGVLRIKDPEHAKYQHTEAFCLMLYTCATCTHREVIYNSRDGVTPFGVQCPSCGSHSLSHADFSLDYRCVSYVPNVGQRYFVDVTPELYAPTRRKMEDALVNARGMSRAEASRVATKYEAQAVQMRAPWLCVHGYLQLPV